MGAREIDFVAETVPGRKEYFQVCREFSGEEAERTQSAQGFGDSFPKTVIVRNPDGEAYTRDGIRVIGIVDWLSERCR